MHNMAVYSDRGLHRYAKSGREDGYTLTDNTSEGDKTTEAVLMSDVLSENELSHIDYLKMDIEGAELEILNSPQLEWLNSVRYMHIEMHLEKREDIQHYVQFLEDRNFRISVVPRFNEYSLIAINTAFQEPTDL